MTGSNWRVNPAGTGHRFEIGWLAVMSVGFDCSAFLQYVGLV